MLSNQSNLVVFLIIVVVVFGIGWMFLQLNLLNDMLVELKKSNGTPTDSFGERLSKKIKDVSDSIIDSKQVEIVPDTPKAKKGKSKSILKDVEVIDYRNIFSDDFPIESIKG